jgi:hypothetical protein
MGEGRMNYTPEEAKAWIAGYDAGRKFAGHGLDLPLVKLDEFLLMIKGSEDMRGRPVMRTEWPMEENLTPERSIQISDTIAAKSSQP